MSLFLKLFETTAEYNAYTADTSNFILPNVSYCQDAMSVHYTPVISIANAVITCDSATYNGQTQVATNIVVTLSGSTLVSGTDYTISNNDGGINAGNYTFTVNGIGNYSGSKNGTFTIGKVTPIVTTPTAKVLTYNGSAQELVNAGSTDYGTLKYSSDGTSYSTSIPTATNYGSYTVYYKVEGDSNVNDVAPATVQCSINEKQVTATVELSQSTYTYDGTAKEPTVTVKDGSTVIDPSEYTVTYSNNINAGTATVTISDNVGGNYEVIGSATFTINKASRTISFTQSASTVNIGETITIVATPSAGSGDGTITYSSSDTTKATINGNVVSGVGAGNATITATIAAGTNYVSATTSYSLAIEDPYVGHAYVDLGLPSGTKWATMNVGASSETDYGNYYQYGKGAAQYAATSGQSDYSGTEDPLSLSVDTANQVWGGSWHMPTLAQCDELIANTTYTWETNFNGSGVNGGKYTASNGKYIFIPAAGRWRWGEYKSGGGFYWSSTPNGSTSAYDFIFNSSRNETNGTGRSEGYTIRGVVG